MKTNPSWEEACRNAGFFRLEVDMQSIRDIERRQFSDRLKKLLVKARIPVLPGTVMKHYNKHVVYLEDRVSHYTVGKWLDAEEMPTVDKMRVLADWLACDVEYLAFGERNRKPVGFKKLSKEEVSMLSTYRSLSPYASKVIRDMLRVLAAADVDSETVDGRKDSKQAQPPVI